MLWKFFYIKNIWLRVKEVHEKNLQAASCAKECQLNRAKPREVKGGSYKLSIKTNVKKAYFLSFTITSGSFLTWGKGNIIEPTLQREGLFWLEKVILIFSNQHWLRSWHNKWERLYLSCLVELLSLIQRMLKTFSSNPHQHSKVVFIDEG